MFKLFDKDPDKYIYPPVAGRCIDITEVSDAAFSTKAMGDGIAIIPETDTICSPSNGKLIMVFRTGHAFGIQTDNGLEILIHIGIDTVNLEGKGFTVLKKQNSYVKKGEPIVKVDMESIKKDYDPTTLVIITNKKAIKKLTIDKEVQMNDKIIEAI